MTAFEGRSGADGIFEAIDRVCKIDRKYHAKMLLAIDLTLAAGLVTTAQKGLMVAFLDAVQAYCDAFHAVADNSGFSPEA